MASAVFVPRVCFPVSYADDYERALAFYTRVLGLKQAVVLAEDRCFLRVGGAELGLLPVRGCTRRAERGEDFTQASYVLRAVSAPAMMVRAAGAKIVQEQPVETGDGGCWFQFFDPAGTLLQILGGK